MTRKPRRGDDRQRLFLTTALTNPAIREIEAEHTDPAPFSDVLQAAAFGLVCGGFAALLAHGLALALLRPGYAMQLVAFGAVALVGALIRAGQIADSRRSRQWATFDAAPEVAETNAPDFVPVSDNGRTLVKDFQERAKVRRFAAMLPEVQHSLAYRQWEGRGRLFSRGEYEQLRAALAALGYERDNALTDAGRAAVARWAMGEFEADEVHRLRGEE